jgi:ketosteroid isomerase-like protein
MADPDMRETWPVFLAALDAGDEHEIRTAFGHQQRAFRTAVLALDVESLQSNIDPDYELHNHTDFFDWRDVYRGVEGMMEWAGQITDTAGDFELVVERIERSGDRVISLGEMHASGRLSQIEATFPWAQVWTLRDGRILRVEVYTDHGSALEALTT